MKKKKFARLSPHVQPERYELMLKPDLEGFIFEGEEIIFLSLGKPVKEITLHSKELKINSVEFRIKNAEFSTAKISYDIKSETATFKFPKVLPRGKGELKISFTGILNDKMRGFYRSQYTHEGKTKHMATTQFEATDARRAFPCFDEPAQKAIFDVTMIVPENLTVISNTLESKISEHSAGYKAVKFLPSPKMSTYLVAFIVGDFEFIEGKTKDGVVVRIFVTPGKKHQAEFALSTAIKCLEFYNKYFDIAYPLPILDLIAIPDFSHGAMENWGAITYRESALLVDPEHSSASNKQWVAIVIAHELAHQWFGNLVTMEWWTHLWLNEGFASYIEYLATDHLFPSWDIWTQFAYSDLGIALKLDALKHTHAIEVEVGHPDEIGEIFDEVSYSKGASVIRMLAGYLGEKDFRDGLRYYLKKHSYKNASTVHLWEAFEKISKKPVRKMMENWTSKPGYPVIKISEKENSLLLTQSRFYGSPFSKKESKENTLWQAPVLYSGDDLKVNKVLLTNKTEEIKKPKSSWLKFNVGETGFYRIEYPSEMLEKLKKPISSKSLSAIDRLAVVRDAFALSEAGEMPTSRALSLIEAYKDETDYTVWVELATGLSSLKGLVYDQSYYKDLEKYGQQIFKKIGLKLGWQKKSAEGESHTQSLLRSLALHQLVGFNHKESLEKGKRLFKGKKVSPDLRSVVYHALAQTGGLKEFKEFILRYKTETLSEEKNRLGRALGQFTKQELLKKTLEFAMSKEVRIQDTAQIFASVWANPIGRKIAWEFTKKNWKVLLERYPSSGHILNRFIKPASVFVAEKDAKDVSAFFKTHSAPGAERAIEQTLEKIYANSAWLKRDSKSIETWLKSNLK
jgi:puromycin-sensitive aminopeptidase